MSDTIVTDETIVTADTVVEEAVVGAEEVVAEVEAETEVVVEDAADDKVVADATPAVAAPVVTEEDKKRARAKRFGCEYVASAAPKGRKGSNKKQKGNSGKAVSADEAAAKAKRAARFGGGNTAKPTGKIAAASVAVDEEEAARRAARAARFAPPAEKTETATEAEAETTA